MSFYGLHFVNQTRTDVYVALITYDAKCGKKMPFRKHGWYLVPAGGSAKVINGDLRDENAYLGWYAHEAHSSKNWPGDRRHKVGAGKFNQCLDNDHNCTIYEEFHSLDTRPNFGVKIYLESPGKYKIKYDFTAVSTDSDGWGGGDTDDGVTTDSDGGWGVDDGGGEPDGDE